MDKLLKSCIGQLCEMQRSSGMAPADRQRLSLVIETLEALERDLADDDGSTRRADIIFRAIECVSRILAAIFLGHG